MGDMYSSTGVHAFPMSMQYLVEAHPLASSEQLRVIVYGLGGFVILADVDGDS